MVTKLGTKVSELGGTLESIVGAIVSGAVAYLFYRFRKIEKDVGEAMTEAQVKEYVDTKVFDVKELLRENTEGIRRVDDKIDSIYKLLIEQHVSSAK